MGKVRAAEAVAPLFTRFGSLVKYLDDILLALYMVYTWKMVASLVRKKNNLGTFAWLHGVASLVSPDPACRIIDIN